MMSIHPNAPSRPSKSNIADPEDLLAFLTSELRLRRRDAEREVIKRFEWWNPWKPEWRPPEFSSLRRIANERVMKLEERLTKPAVRRFFGRDSTASGISAKKRLRRGNSAAVAQTREDREGENLFEEGDRAISEWTSKAAHSSYDDFLIQGHHSSDDVVRIFFAALTRMKGEHDAAISTIQTLAEERTRLRTHIAAQGRSHERPNPLYKKVGLHQDCPDWLIPAARTAYRRRCHPDAHPPQNRTLMETKFKEAEEVFSEILRLRKS